MGDTAVPITAGAGTNIDTRTETTNSNHRQVVVLGDPALNANVAAVATQDVGGNDQTTPALLMRLAGSASVSISGSTGTLGVHIASTGGTIAVSLNPGTIAVSLDPGHTLGKVDAGAGTFTVQFDPGHELGTIRGNSNTLTVFLPDTGHEIGTIRGNTNTLTVFLPDTGHEIGTIRGNSNTLTVFLPDTGHTLGKVDQGSPTTIGTSAWLVNAQHTASIFTVAGSTAGVSVSGVTLISPSANASFKVFAFSLQTTGIVSVVARFTNGAGTSPTEFWRGLATSNQTSSTPIGANLAVPPPAHLFATGVSTTLALLLDTATLVHYSISYIKESA